jgi:hypothetical protein
MDGDTLIPLSGWTMVQDEKGQLGIQTAKPENTSWTFYLTPTTIDIECSRPDGIFTGIAPAGEKRIPARIKSQDNDIMYTQMGFVTATNIYNLFDMNTDVLISFTKGSKLTRNDRDERLMDVTVHWVFPCPFCCIGHPPH